MQPRQSFELLQYSRPTNAKTILIPAIEILTREGVEFIAFAENPEYLYHQRDIMTPYKLTAEEFVNRVASEAPPQLNGIVIHPCTPGSTSVVRKCGEQFTKQAIQKLKMIEKHNCCLSTTQHLIEKLRLKNVWKTKYEQLCKTLNAPESLIETTDVVRTAGSDAHFPWEMGDYMEFEESVPQDRNALISILTTKSGTFHERTNKPIIGIIIGTLTVIREYLTKKLHLYRIDSP